MRRSRLRQRVTVPRISTVKTETKDYEYVKGWDSNTTNDDLPQDFWRQIIDAREPQVGKWKTRIGADELSIPIGEAINVQQTSTAGASDFSFNSTTWFAKKIVATATGVLSKIEVNLKNTLSATGTVVIALYSDSSGAPGEELFRTTVPSSSVTATYGYKSARSITCPSITNTSTYWVVGFVQDGGANSYQVSTTTNASTGLSSVDGGNTWTAASLDFNVKLYTATSGGVKGHIFFKRPNSTNYLAFAHGTSVYSVDLGTGVTTAIDTGISSSATRVRFQFVNDKLYYTTGFQKPRKYDFTAASEVSGAPENASNLIEHQGMLFYTSAVDTSKEYFTNFAAYETFTSTDFYYVPAPKTADPVTAKFKLNGALYHCTRQNKYVLYGAESATFRLDSAIGQKGTYSQESVAYDEDKAYLANDDGIWRFNGAEEVNIAEPILASWRALTSRESVVLEIFNNRLYVYHTPVGGGENSQCFVYNELYGIWESLDTLGYVSTATARTTTDDYMILGSNRCGMVMYSEKTTNDHSSMGEPLSYELRTGFNHYMSPSSFKRSHAYRPHFDSVRGTWSVDMGYALDYSPSPTYTQISLEGNGVRLNTGVLLNSGAIVGTPQQIAPMDDAPIIAGEWRRAQIVYRHYAAREPVSFDGHALAIETQRMR